MLCKLVNVLSSADKPRQALDLCHLPLHFVETEELSLGTTVVIHIQSSSMSNSDDDVQYTNSSYYYKWSGDVSRRFPDCIEVQCLDMELENIKMVRASVVHPIPRKAMEVHVTPSTLYDWGKFRVLLMRVNYTFLLIFFVVISMMLLLTSTQLTSF